MLEETEIFYFPDNAILVNRFKPGPNCHCIAYTYCIKAKAC